MKTRFALACACVAGAAMAVAGDAYWRGDGKVWNATDNDQNTVDGSWWGTSSTSGWVAMPSAEAIAYVYNGKECVVTDGTVITGEDVSKIFLNTAGGADGSTLTIEDGAKIGPNVGIVVGATGGQNNTKLSYLHIKGGDLKLGRSGSYMYSLMVGSANSGSNSRGFAWMDGGTVEIDSVKDFNVAAGNKSVGSFALTNGSMTVKANTFVGCNTTSAAETDATFIQAGGTFVETATFYAQRNSLVDLCGGSFSATNLVVRNGGWVRMPQEGESQVQIGALAVQDDAHLDIYGGTFEVSGTLSVEKGGTIRVAMPLAVEDVGVLQFNNAGVAGSTNVIEIVRGGSILRSDASGLSFGGTGSALHRLAVAGGSFTNSASLSLSNSRILIEVSDGGTFYVKPKNGYGNMTPGENNAYYMRLRGRVEASSGCWGVPSTRVTTTAFRGVENIIVEHVIEAGETSPLIARGGAGDSTQAAGNYIPGNQRIRPAGGVQVVSTNQFALFYSPKSATHTLNSEVYTSAPDATLWTSGELASYYWGCTLNAEAKISLTRESTASFAYRSETFAARPMGYCELPKMGKDKLNGVSVSLTVAAPEGGSLEGALASVKAGLESAGYTNVETNGATGLATFDVPLERIAEKSVDQKLLLDFTETPMPATGMMAHKVAANYAYPTVTNALFTAVSVTYDKPVEGMMLIVK